MLSKTLKLIAEIDRKFAWSFIGVLLAVYFGVSALPNTSLRYEIISNSRVLDIHNTLGKLECFYDKWSLSKNNEELRLIRLRVVNNGNKTILTSFYDDNAPLGLVISYGHLIEKPELITQLTQSNYLLKNLKVTVADEKTVKFSKVILEPNDQFGISLLVKVQTGLTTNISPIGKIAEIRNIEVRDIYKEEEQPYLYNILTKAIEGDPNVQLIRVIIYNIGLLIIFTLFSIVTVYLHVIYIIRTRKNLIREFKQKTGKEYIHEEELFRFYVTCKNPLSLFSEMREVLQRGDLALILKTARQYNLDEPPYKNLISPIWSVSGTHHIAAVMDKIGFFKTKDNDIIIDRDKLQTVDDLTKFLKSKGEYFSGEDWTVGYKTE